MTPVWESRSQSRTVFPRICENETILIIFEKALLFGQHVFSDSSGKEFSIGEYISILPVFQSGGKRKKKKKKKQTSNSISTSFQYQDLALKEFRT